VTSSLIVIVTFHQSMRCTFDVRGNGELREVEESLIPNCTSGVPQGSVLGQLLFILYFTYHAVVSYPITVSYIMAVLILILNLTIFK